MSKPKFNTYDKLYHSLDNYVTLDEHSFKNFKIAFLDLLQYNKHQRAKGGKSNE